VEKVRHLTRKMMNTSTGVGDVGGGRKHVISAGGGEGEAILVVDFELDLLRACVEELQRDEEKLVVAMVRRKMVGDDGATVMQRRRCSLFSLKLSSRSFAWSRGEEGAAARGWRGCGLGFALASVGK
jgi:hypothetical protein